MGLEESDSPLHRVPVPKEVYWDIRVRARWWATKRTPEQCSRLVDIYLRQYRNELYFGEVNHLLNAFVTLHLLARNDQKDSSR